MAETDAPRPVPDAHLPQAAGLEERERSVLEELARELDARVSFQGLRRQLGVHQQALSRTLRRLLTEGLVAHDGSGYQITERGATLLRAHPWSGPQAPALRVLELLLPPGMGAGDVAAHLARRWFGGLRWYGQSEGGGETALHWRPEDGRGRVVVRVAGGALTLEIQPDQTGEVAFPALRPVLGALAELYGASPAGPPAS